MAITTASTVRGENVTGINTESADTKSNRQKAVKAAWAYEKELVLQGKGTRDWTVAQQKELLETGCISGFEGQHMKNVSSHPELAGDRRNIQFLHYLEHLYGAHGGDFRNDTEGYYDTTKGEMIPFEGDDIPEIPVMNLTDRYIPDEGGLVNILGREFGYKRKEDFLDSREKHKEEKSTYNFWNGEK